MKKQGNFKHGKHGTPEYESWRGMKERCYNPNNKRYEDYGGKGIKVCARWKDFSNFYADMGDRPKGTTLDRYPDKYGNYEPSNCRWGTEQEQVRNKTNNVLITFNGQTKCMAEWAEFYNLEYATLKCRLRRYKWPIEKALTASLFTGNKYGRFVR